MSRSFDRFPDDYKKIEDLEKKINDNMKER
jgi:hypothetical protein